MPQNTDPVAAADPEARALARSLLAAPHAALAYAEAESGLPSISRIAFGLAPDGTPMTLISALAPHFAGLRRHADCAIMVGEPEGKGDPLTHPRLMVRARASFIEPSDPERPALRDHWLATHPKARLYIDFADFALVRLIPQSAVLNAGFAKAYRLTAADLIQKP